MRKVFLVVLAGYSLSGLAQTLPKITSASFEWAQRGTTNRLVLQGEHLAHAKEIVISGDPGVSASIAPVAMTQLQVESTLGGVTTVAPPSDKSLQVQVVVSESARLTERELRVVTAEGVSNPIPIKVSPLPEVASQEENKTPEGAQQIVFPSIISGVISSPSEVDHYKFTSRAGERLLFEVQAFRLGSQLDSSLTILDATGAEVARNEDFAGLDSVLHFVAPADGEYKLLVRDFRHLGAPDYRYRLIAGALPYVTSHFPLGGKRGQPVEVELTGFNLEGANKVSLHLASHAPLGRQDLRAATARGLSNPFPFDTSDLPEILEQEPNTALDQADSMPLPGVVNGRIQSPKDYDAFRFTAQKDQALTFEIQAHRFGSPLDALLTLTDAKGNVLARNDDAAGADARIDHTFAEAGDYFILVEDLLQRGGSNYTYRLIAAPPKQDFSITFSPDTPRIHKGGRFPIRVELNRINGFDDTVRVQVDNLPSGVYAEPLIFVPGGVTVGYLFLTATSAAPLGSYALNLSGTSASLTTMTRPAQPLAGDKPVKAAFLTLLEPANFSISPATLMATIEQNRSGEIPLLIERNGYNGELVITPEGFSAGREQINKSFEFQPLKVAPDQNQAVLTLAAKLDSEIGTRFVWFKAEALVNGNRQVQYSAPLPVATTEIPFVLSTTLKKIAVTALPASSQSAAREAFFTVKANRRAGFDGEILLELGGVPEGIELTADKIPANGTEAIVRFVASEKALTGKEHQLTVRGKGLFKERNYQFQPPAITLSVNAPEPAETTLAEAN